MCDYACASIPTKRHSFFARVRDLLCLLWLALISSLLAFYLHFMHLFLLLAFCD